MKINGLIAGLILTVLVPKGNYAQGKKEQDTLIYFREDSLLTEDLLRRFSDCREEPVASLLVEIGRSLVGTPYVSHTLENGIEEKLVVNLRELDCTTFAENCLALARTIRSGETQFGYFVRELQHIRYRDGLRQGYLSRLHYFSEWIGNNVQKGLIAEPAACFGSTLDVQVGFMSAHSGNYSVLSSNPELVPLLVKQEKKISSGSYFFLKKENLPGKKNKLQEGDIVGLTSTLPGLDVAHVGILVRQNGCLHLMHASSALGKIVISELPLEALLKNRKSWSGLMIARPLD